MARRMLIDASHPEETRVVVVDGTRLEEFDFETASRKPLKGNIYLAKVIRIEPSLQAAFVEYGGNRHGFLAFSEIHADYYQIPVADRERLIAEQQRLQAEHEEEADREPTRVDRTDIEEARAERQQETAAAIAEGAVEVERPPPEQDETAPSDDAAAHDEATQGETAHDAVPHEAAAAHAPADAAHAADAEPPAAKPHAQPAEIVADRIAGEAMDPSTELPATASAAPADSPSDLPVDEAAAHAADPAEAPQPDVTVETLGGDDAGVERERRERRRRQPVRTYKIQEVIKRRQILLVQVVKEERGNKGAALTTYLSLAGRYCVLMPNAGRGGGISRKISNPADRKRMKDMLAQLDVPAGMGVILRTAGLERSNIDIKRDYEYLSRLWDSIRELTMRSTAPALIYEEGDLIKRSLRDVYDTDIDQVLVEGEAGFQSASEFMRQLVPHQASKVVLYGEPIPLFHRYQVESQFDAMHSPVVQLRSGGYIVINPTEALVAIDVNSGRATRERNIEETALRTNVEAAEEIARQVRLRDLAGLIVIDFIDMEETRHQRQVEHKVKDAMRNDRARIQIGRISAFGLLEMSRQRLRPSLLEHSTEVCPHCAGTGRVRSIESAALHALRAIEEEGVRRRASEILVSVPPNVALYILNQKRHALSDIEKRYGFHVTIESDEELHAADCEIERVRSRRDDHHRPAQELARASYDEVDGQAPAAAEAAANGHDGASPEDDRAAGDEDGDGPEGGRGRRRRRRRRRGPRREGEGPMASGDDERAYGEAGNGAEARRPEGEPREGAMNGEPHGEPNGEPHGEQGPEGDEGPRPYATEHAGPDETVAPGEAFGERGNGHPDGERGERPRRRGRRGGRRRRRENGEGGDYTPRGEGGDSAPRADDAGFAPHGAGGDDAPRANNGEHAPRGEGGERRPAASAGQPFAGLPGEHTPGRHSPGGHTPIERAPDRPQPSFASEAAPAPPPPTIAPPPRPVMAEAPQPAPTPAPPPPPLVPTISVDTPPEQPKRGWWRR